MKKRILGLMAVWCTAPFAAWASWDILGIGTIAQSVAEGVKAGADAAWKITLIAAIQKVLPQLMAFLLLIVCVICAVVALALAARMADDFKDIISEELKAAQSWFNRATVIFYGLIALPTILGLLAFGMFLAYASYSGISGFMK